MAAADKDGAAETAWLIMNEPLREAALLSIVNAEGDLRKTEIASWESSARSAVRPAPYYDMIVDLRAYLVSSRGQEPVPLYRELTGAAEKLENAVEGAAVNETRWAERRRLGK